MAEELLAEEGCSAWAGLSDGEGLVDGSELLDEDDELLDDDDELLASGSIASLDGLLRPASGRPPLRTYVGDCRCAEGDVMGRDLSSPFVTELRVTRRWLVVRGMEGVDTPCRPSRAARCWL